MKQTGMLVVSLEGVISDVRFCLGCSRQNPNILSRQGLSHKEIEKINYIFSNFGFSRGHKKYEPCPDWSPLGILFKISNEHPCLLHVGVPQVMALSILSLLNAPPPLHFSFDFKNVANAYSGATLRVQIYN